MQIFDILKNTEYSDSIFSVEEIAELQNDINIKKVKNKDTAFIVCAVRKKEIRLTPEEVVRQLYVRKLINRYGYPDSRLKLEYEVHFGLEIKRADIVVFDKARPDVPYIIVELKKPKLSAGKEQLRSYCNATGAPIGVWTNGQNISHYHRKDPNYFEELTNIPGAAEKLSDIINERFTYADLQRVDKIANERRSLRSIIEEMEDEVLANAGVDSFEEIFKLLFAKIYDELVCARDKNAYLKFRNSGDTDTELQEKIQELFDAAKAKWDGIFAKESRIQLAPSHLAVCVSHLQNIKLFNNNLDVIDDAFEFLMNKSQKGEKGQYFTPRYVIDMCVKMMNPHEDENIIDTAAGSSGFPVHAIFHVWRKIREAEGLPDGELFTAELRTERELNFVRDHIFAIDFDEKTVRVARTLNLIAGDGQSNVIHLNTLDYPRWKEVTQGEDWNDTYNEGFKKLKKIRKTARGDDYAEFEFDLLMANPPFAGDIKESMILSRYELAKNDKGKVAEKVGRDILFIERNLNFLKPGGRMAIVLPQGRFNNSSDKRIREFIAERCRIIAVVGLHGNVFKPHTGTKTSVLFVQKWDDEKCPQVDDYPIFFATMQKPSKDNSGDKIYVKDAGGNAVLDSHAHLIVDHDLYNHEGLTQDGIAEAFIEFAKREKLSFFAKARPFDADRYAALLSGLDVSEVQKSDLERTFRIDAEFYNKENLLISGLLSKKSPVLLSDLVSVSDGNHMTIADEFSDKGVKYYRGQDMSNFFIEESFPVRISEKTFNSAVMLRSHLKQGDVLLSIVGTIGKTALVYNDEKQTCSCKIAILRPNKKNLAEIIAVFLSCKYGQNQIQKFVRGAVQMGFLLEDTNQIDVPTFSSKFIEEIKQVVIKAHSKSLAEAAAYAEAEAVLTAALGMANFKPDAGAIAVKTLSSSFGASGRLDAEFYQGKYDSLFAMLAKLPCKKLGDLVEIQKSIEPGSEYYGDTGVPFVRVSDITKYGIQSPEIHIPAHLTELRPRKNTILLSKDGTVGIAYKLDSDMDVITSGALLHLCVTADILPDYLALVLNSEIVQLQAERDAGGSVIQHWKPSEIAEVIVPILDTASQTAISVQVQQSFALRRESERLLDVAKRAVELAIEQGEDKAEEYLMNTTRIVE